MQGGSQCGSCRSLLLMDRLADRAGLGNGARDVKQDQHGKVAPAAKGVEVNCLIGCASGHHLHACLDGHVDIDVLAVNLTVAAIQTDAETGERSTQSVFVRHTQPRIVFRVRSDLPDGAPVWTVTPSMDIPLRRHGR